MGTVGGKSYKSNEKDKTPKVITGSLFPHPSETRMLQFRKLTLIIRSWTVYRVTDSLCVWSPIPHPHPVVVIETMNRNFTLHPLPLHIAVTPSASLARKRHRRRWKSVTRDGCWSEKGFFANLPEDLRKFRTKNWQSSAYPFSSSLDGGQQGNFRPNRTPEERPMLNRRGAPI